MKKLRFSELMNLLLISVIIILIFRIPSNQVEVIAESKASANTNTQASKKLEKLDDKTYQLPTPEFTSNISVEESMLNRRSQRDYRSQAITAQQLSQVLWSAYGITQAIEEPEFLRGGLKTAPSAGARYPLDIYVLIGNVDGLKKGLYKFLPNGHKLLKLNSADLRHELCIASYDQLMIQEAPAVLLYSAIFERCTSKYGDRGRERYVCMDLGHSAENVYLQVQSLGLGTCAIGAFNDEEVSNIINLPTEEEPLYILPIGYYNEKAEE
ncbi:SagB/ThcOx family dehydrogenase [Carboxylicivirga sp. N1Y90]|uniref:SagB/ThcOx family dehydrogenase n=1 Tax=Carboxylicivirga fragile TaxID=3417571 RepID=UPI003D335BA7|nr:SagB/ThcOx family dehydrogenase [Marinilabiliaceae bacterium N1Y90]